MWGAWRSASDYLHGVASLRGASVPALSGVTTLL